MCLPVVEVALILAKHRAQQLEAYTATCCVSSYNHLMFNLPFLLFFVLFCYYLVLHINHS